MSENNIVNGRVNGRFAKGNKFGLGNPSHRRMSKLRHALLGAVTKTDIQEITRKLAEQAKAGNVQAAKLLLDHALGKPVQAIELTGKDGEALGLSLADLQIGIWDSLKDIPEARAKVALALRQLTMKADPLPNGLKELPVDGGDGDAGRDPGADAGA